MTALEKAARAILDEGKNFGALAHMVRDPSYTLEMRLARAVISSIEVDDAMVIAAWHAMEPAVVLPEHAEAAIKAALRSILDEGEGR